MASDLINPAPHLNLKEGYYKISATNGIYSVQKQRFLSDVANRGGYVGIGVMDSDGNLCSRYAHVIIKESFHGKTPDNMVIDHIDRIKDHNTLSNLRFVTHL